MKQVFITGIPTAGKTYVAERVASLVGGIHVDLDSLRRELSDSPLYFEYVSFYHNQDEKGYYTTTTYEEQWKNLVHQCEGLWSAMLEKIQEYKNETRPVIFEGVYLLPHLMSQTEILGIVLIGNSLEEIIERNKKSPRWGKTEELQKLEADAFFFGERPHYKAEAEKYGYKVFENGEDAISDLIKMLS